MKKSISSPAVSSLLPKEVLSDDLGFGEQGGSLTLHPDKHYATKDTVESDAFKLKGKLPSGISRPGLTRKLSSPQLQTQGFLHQASRESKLLDAMKELLRENSITWGGRSLFKRNGNSIDQVRSRLEQKKPFGKWMKDSTTLPSEMNCWEAVIYAGFIAQLVTIEDIKKMVATEVIHVGQEDPNVLNKALDSISFVKRILEDDLTTRIGPISKYSQLLDTEKINARAGYVVIFGGAGEHVALSLGGQEIIELDRDSGKMADGKLARSTFSDLYRRKPQYFTDLSWGPFPSP